MNEEKTSKKKQLILAGIGLAFLLVLVVGATYAYFTFASQNEFKDPATIEGSLGELGAGVSLTRAEDHTLTLNLSAADMLVENAQTYYASGSETPKTIATVKVAGGGIFNCTYTLEVTKTSETPETDMYERFQSEGYTNKGEGQIYFTVNDTVYDFNTAELFDANGKLTYSGTLSMITSEEDINLTANMAIVNLSDKDQTYLNGTDVSLSINATEFNCDLVDTNAEAAVEGIALTSDDTDSLTIEVIATDTYGIENYSFSIDGGDAVTQEENTYTFEGLEPDTEYEVKTTVTNVVGNTTESTTTLRTGKTVAQACPGNSISDCLETASGTGLQKTVYEGDDLYRYVGNEGNTGINNYICLGATSCTSGDNNMYRIIGVNPETNELKVIKETRLSFTDEAGTVTNTFQWNTATGVTWENSSLYTTLNTTWLDSITFGDMIVAKTWDMGDVPYATGKTKSTIIPLETATQTTNTAKVGALSATDYVMAYTEEGDWTNSAFYKNYTNNWIHAINNNWSATAVEWTMSRSSSANARYVRTNGNLNNSAMTVRYAARPVFYLASGITYESGTGEVGSPFIVSMGA